MDTFWRAHISSILDAGLVEIRTRVHLYYTKSCLHYVCVPIKIAFGKTGQPETPLEISILDFYHIILPKVLQEELIRILKHKLNASWAMTLSPGIRSATMLQLHIVRLLLGPGVEDMTLFRVQ